MAEKVEIPPFNEFFPVSYGMLSVAETKGVAWVLANRFFSKYRPCAVCSVYYLIKPVEYIEPEYVVFREDGTLGVAEFDYFVISYDEDVKEYDVIAKDEEKVAEKYGKDFIKEARSIVGVISEDGVCRLLLVDIRSYELKRKGLTFDGVRALYTVAALKLMSIRERKAEVAEEIREVVEEVKGEVMEIPELDMLADAIKSLSRKYRVSVSRIVEMLRERLA